MSEPTTKKFRSWCFTWNNYSEADWNLAPKLFEGNEVKINYLVQGKEVGENGTPHIQGFIHFDTQRTLGGLKKIFGPQPHWEPKSPKSTFEQAAAYCKKDGNFIELGVLPKQGARSDLHALVADAKKGTSIDEAAEIHGETALKYLKSYRELSYQYALKARYAEGFRTMRIHIYYGDTSTGKSKTANELHGYPNTRSLKNTATGYWFDGVDCSTKTIILDEFTGNMPFTELLDICDGQPKSFQIKGSMTINWWDTVVITSNQDPRTWYANTPKQSRDAFWARVTKVVKFTGTSIEDCIQTVELEKAYREPVPFTFKTYVEQTATAENFNKPNN